MRLLEDNNLSSSWKDATDDRSEYENENASLGPSEKSDRLDLKEDDKKSIIQYEDESDEHQEQAESGQVVGPIDPEDIVYDRVIIRWDEIPPIAGRKRQRSIEPQIIQSKRGRPVMKIDNYKLHNGKMVKTNNDPKTWSEAMSSSEVKNWQQAAKEEYRSLRDTGTI